MKVKTTYYCRNCGAQFPKWMGQCTSCKQWNTIEEEVVGKPGDIPAWQQDSKTPPASVRKNPVRLTDVDGDSESRFPVADAELDLVLGGGLVPGSVILLGGEPGVGKSTLLLQVALRMGDDAVYVSGEESLTQIKMRARRIGLEDSGCLFITETGTPELFRHLGRLSPRLVIVDSIQTLHTPVVDASPGSISQIRETTAEFIRYAKETGTSVILIGHITKDGQIAGPKVLEHMVDVVLQFEGDRHHLYRLLRVFKNRFGSTSEIGIYEMNDKGLQAVVNPSQRLLSESHSGLSGTALGVIMEGMRPLVIEVQALVSKAVFGTPQRSVTGYDLRRMHMLLAVLEKRSGFQLGASDVFLNITGGIRVVDPALDLAVIAAVISSLENQAVPEDVCFAGEVGLTGEVRPVLRVERRISEAEKMGFKRIFISDYNPPAGPGKHSIKVERITGIEEMYARLFG